MAFRENLEQSDSLYGCRIIIARLSFVKTPNVRGSLLGQCPSSALHIQAYNKKSRNSPASHNFSR